MQTRTRIPSYQEKRELAEQLTIERLLDTFPSGIISYVSDTYDIWAVCSTILPRLKDKILNRDGKLVIRPDSGDPADIVCGIEYVEHEGKKYSQKDGTWLDNDTFALNHGIAKPITENESKGVVELLWDVFGGKINNKGYKELDSHIGVIYGDSISRERAEDICSRLEKKGFASNNIVFGIGSYTYNYNTRDSLGIAVKSTYCEVDGIPREIFKDPVTDNGVKKSARGLLKIDLNENRDYVLKDCVSKEEETQGYLKPVFSDGELLVDDELNAIRTRVKEAEIWLQPAVEEHEM